MNKNESNIEPLCAGCQGALVNPREVHTDTSDLHVTQPYCRTCSTMNAFRCDLSGEWWLSGEFTRETVEDSGDRFCLEAFDDGYGDMPSLYYYNDGYHSEEESDDNPDGGDVVAYHEGPRPWNHHAPDGTPKVGIELEVECGDGSTRRELASLIHRLRAGFLCETDGSLSWNGGMEIVAPPVHPDRVREQWEPVLRIVESVNCPGHTGQHVNQDRGWVGDDGFRGIASVVHRYHRWFKRLTGRDSTYGAYMPGYRWGNPIGGYVAVHAAKSGRVEWRIFRGTVSPDCFFANVELTMAVKEYVDATDPVFFRTADTAKIGNGWRKGLAGMLRAGKYTLLKERMGDAGMIRFHPKTGRLSVPSLKTIGAGQPL